MSYIFGIGKEFNGTNEEWEELKKTEVVYNSIKYGGVTVSCPHCGSKNNHSANEGHRVCDKWPKYNNPPKVILYDCPGYTLKKGLIQNNKKIKKKINKDTFEYWCKQILLDEENIMYPFSEVVDFLEDTELEDIDEYTESWETFKDYLETIGFSDWDNDRKQGAANTYFIWKKGHRVYSPWYLKEKRGNFEESLCMDMKWMKYYKLKKENIYNFEICNKIKMIEMFLDTLTNEDINIRKYFEINSTVIDLESYTLKLCKLLNSDEHHKKRGYINKRDKDGIRIYKEDIRSSNNIVENINEQKIININKVHTNINKYSLWKCASYNYDKPNKMFIPCKRKVITSLGCCKKHRDEFIQLNGYCKYGMNKITGKGATPLNRREYKHYPNYDKEYENKITNPVILKFLNEPTNYIPDYFPTHKDMLLYFPEQLNEEELIKAEKENDIINIENNTEENIINKNYLTNCDEEIQYTTDNNIVSDTELTSQHAIAKSMNI